VHPTADDQSDFASLLARIQERTGMSDQRIADAAGVNRSQVWRWVNAGSAPGYEPVRRLAAFLLADRPEIADMAASLLPAAGYEAPPDDSAREPRLHFGENEGIPPERLAPHIASVRRDLAAAIMRYGPDHTGSQAFPAAPYEAAVWDRKSMAAGDREELIAIFRYFAAEGASLVNGEDTGGKQTGLCRG
jgi:transcriptional regulator with XRE-family HTH domain